MRYLKFLFFLLILNCKPKVENFSNSNEIESDRIKGVVKLSENLIGVYYSNNFWKFKKIEGEDVVSAEDIRLPEHSLLQIGLYKNRPLGVFKEKNQKIFYAVFEKGNWKKIDIKVPSLLKLKPWAYIPIAIEDEKVFWVPALRALSVRSLPFICYSDNYGVEILNFPYNVQIVSIWLEKDKLYLSTLRIREVKEVTPDMVRVEYNIKDPLEIWEISKEKIKKVAEIIPLEENPVAPVFPVKGKYKTLYSSKLKDIIKIEIF